MAAGGFEQTCNAEQFPSTNFAAFHLVLGLVQHLQRLLARLRPASAWGSKPAS
jgi:hypothetical protein